MNMNSTNYLQEIEERLSRNFNIERDNLVLDEELSLFAKMEIHNESYFASKKVKVWHVENYEYVFIKSVDTLNENSLQEFQDYLKKAIDHFVKPHSEHMFSVITGVLVVDQFDDSLIKKINQFKYRKSFALSFKGWAEIRLIVVDYHTNRVISNRKGKEVEGFYLPIMEEKKKGILDFIKK